LVHEQSSIQTQLTHAGPTSSPSDSQTVPSINAGRSAASQGSAM
jgi:hypothetical protein